VTGRQTSVAAGVNGMEDAMVFGTLVQCVYEYEYCPHNIFQVAIDPKLFKSKFPSAIIGMQESGLHLPQAWSSEGRVVHDGGVGNQYSNDGPYCAVRDGAQYM